MGTWKAGFAKRVVNPPAGTGLAGYGLKPERTAEAVLDDLVAHAIAFDDGRKKAVLISVDTIMLPTDLAQTVRARIADSAKLEPGAVLISATHTHSSPATGFLRQWGALNPAYNVQLERQIGDAALEALQNLAPAAVGFGQTEVHGIAFNRVRKEGPVDHTLRVLGVRDPQAKQVRLAAANFSCHPVHMQPDSRFVSADYPGRLVRDIERDHPGAQALFFQGALGDINPTGVFKGVDAAQEAGRALGIGARQAIEALEYRTDGEIAFAQTACELPLDWERARQEALDYLYKGIVRADHRWIALGGLMRAWSTETLGLVAANPPAVLRCEVHAIRIGESAIVGLPGEMYTLIAQSVRERSPFKNTWVVGFANGSVGYVADPRDYAEGTYAAIMCPKIYGQAPFQPRAWAAVVDASVEALKALK